MKISIIIPARYASKRLPGKPLISIAGQSMLSRVVAIAKEAATNYKGVSFLVATDDERIASHCDELGVEWVMTPVSCLTGSDRVREAIRSALPKPDFVVNLQGDTPLTPPSYVSAIIDAFLSNPKVQVVTPVVRLSWEELDLLRESKHKTPFSGTCAIIDKEGRAIWFSKNIIPAIRNEDSLRESEQLSPIFKHVGIYGYTPEVVEAFTTWEPSHYELLEGLEQLRILENGVTIQTVTVKNSGRPIIGVDSPEDVIRVEKLLATEAGGIR